jgi:hypothetical protein
MRNIKKLIGITVLCAGLGTCAVSHADGWHHGGGHYYWRPGYGWVVPAVVGGAIVYEATRPNVVVVQPSPVVPAPVVVPPQAPAGYHWEAILDANSNAYRTVLVPN